ncbi:MAG: beta-galactosidase, partial [Lentisphaeria bacterium]|nr:beta-galactosidase [Lentisphaeria bacterium]
TSVKNWNRKQFHKITLTWGKGKQQLCIDRKIVAENRKSGTLGDFNSLELGGRDFSLSFQGIIDDVKISSGRPLDIIPPDFEGDPKKFQSITVPRTMLEKWDNEPKTAEITVTKKANSIVFDYAGKKEYLQRTRMAQTIPVRPRSVLRTDLALKKIKWQYGSRVDLQLEFLDEAKNILKKNNIDSSAMGSGYIAMLLSELSSLTAKEEDISYFNYFKVPEKSTQVRLSAIFAGNPCQLELKEWKLREVDPELLSWFSQPEMGRQLTYPDSPAVSSDDELRRLSANRHRAISKLVKNQDRIEWYINGQKIPPAILHNPITGSYERVSAFKRAGFKLFTSPVILGKAPYPDDYNQIWCEDGTIDVSGMEKAVYRVLRENPEGYVILNLLVCPNARWLKSNRNELYLDKDGKPVIFRNGAFTSQSSAEFPDKRGETWSPSIHSRKYRKDMGKILAEIMQKFEQTDAAKAVAGIYITGGDDGQFRAPVIPDNSPAAQEAFRQYLKAKYKTSEALSAAWRKKISWEEISIPTLAQIKGQKQITFPDGIPCLESDFQEFISKECSSLKKDLRRAVKNAAPRLLVGGYDCATALSGNIWYGRGAFAQHELICDPCCDFLISLPGYGRGRDECLFPMGLKAYTGSMRLHKKLIISEMDIRNPKQPPLGWIYRSRNWQAVHDYHTFTELLKLYAGYAAAWGGAFHAYSMGNKYYNTPEALAAWEKACAIASAAPGEPMTEDRIAWINEERSADFFCNSNLGHFNSESWNRNVVNALWFSQIRFDAYLPEDLSHPDFKAPKILLFGNMATATPQKLAAIRKRFLQRGRTLIFLGLPGIFSGNSIAEISSALNIQFYQPETIRNRSIMIDPSTEPLLKNITGYLYSPAESSPCVHFGNTAIAPQKDLKLLARYQNTDAYGMAFRRSPAGTEIFIGQPAAVSPQLLRNIAIAAGIQPVTDGDDLAIRGGGLIVIGGSTGSGLRRVYYPAGVKSLQCLTGQKIIADNGKYLEFHLKYGDCAIFRCIRN